MAISKIKPFESMKVKAYFKKHLIPNLTKEIDSYIALMEGRDKKDGAHIITYNEVAMVSLLMAAFVREESREAVWALQEYEVFNENGRFKGRGDLYVSINKNELKCDLLIEAKRDGEFNPKAEINGDWYEELDNTMEQGEKYFRHEETYFDNLTFVVTMFFGTLKKEDKGRYNKYEFPTVDTIHDTEDYRFFIAPKGSDSMLCVYGQIKKVKPKQ